MAFSSDNTMVFGFASAISAVLLCIFEMSADSIRLIVDSLNKEPFNLSISLVSFDNFSNERLLQTLSDVICWLSQTDRIEIQNEAAEDTALRIFQVLKIINFKPPQDIEQLDAWRAGIVEGAKASVYPVLAFIFQDPDPLKERLYLSKYLMKIDVPPEYRNEEISAIEVEIEELIGEFMDVHSKVMEHNNLVEAVEGIKQDLQSMEEEKEQITRRIERVQGKIKNLPDLERYLEFAEKRRVENERAQNLENQKAEIRSWMIQTEKKIKKLGATLEEKREAAKQIDPTDIMNKMEEETNTNRYLMEKLNREIASLRPVVGELSKIVHGPAVDDSDIDKLQNEIDRKSTHMRQLIEERDRSEEKHDDNFSIYRHQASVIERKKEAMAQRLQEKRMELEVIESQINEKKREVQSKNGGADIVTSVQFKNYVNQMRQKTNEYKKKRGLWEDSQAENNILSHTAKVLARRWNQLKEQIEETGGEITDISVLVPTEPLARPKTAAPRTDDRGELRGMVLSLQDKLSMRSNELAPLKEEHNEKLETFNRLIDAHREKKRDCERKKAAMEAGFAHIRQQLDDLEDRDKRVTGKLTKGRESLDQAQSRIDRLKKERMGSVRPLLKQLEDELQQTQKTVEELEKNQGEQKDIEYHRRQRKVWEGLLRFFEVKLKVEKESANIDTQSVPIGDRL